MRKYLKGRSFMGARVFLQLLGLLCWSSSFASHTMGGDVTYRCLGGNQFEITLILYQDCLDGQPQAINEDDPAWYAIYTKGPNPTLVQSAAVPSTLTINQVPTGFSNDCINNYPNTCMRMQQFKFTVQLPPTDKGYYIVYQRCCRNMAITNINQPGNIGVTFMAEIPPFVNNECPNNSAVFNHLPPQIICANNPFVYDFSASDADGDSLSYEFCEAHIGGSTVNPRPTQNAIQPPPYRPVSYVPPYSATTPMPGNPPLQINPETGLVTGHPSRVGRYVVTVCVHEWRNGVIVNTISRDFQFIVTDCSKAVLADIPELSDRPNVFQIQCSSYTVQFENNSLGGNTYLWRFGVNGATSTQFEPIYTYPDTGVYKVTLIVNPGSTCQDSISRLVKIYPYFNAGFSFSGKLCPGEELQFTDESEGTYHGGHSVLWNFGDGSPLSTDLNPRHVFPKPGGAKMVTLIATSELGCVDSSKQEIPVDYIEVNAGNDTSVVQGYPVQFHGSGAEQYRWDPIFPFNDPNIPNPIAVYPNPGRFDYILYGETSHGCKDQDSLTVWVVDKSSVFVPTGFTPNGDGINDFLEPHIVGYQQIDYFRIYNRFGQVVYATTRDNKPSWDGTFNGKACELGTYFWEIKLTRIEGEKVIQKGDVTLIR